MRLYPVNIVGQDPAEILLQSPKQYGYLKTFSALMHIIIYIKIQMFKRKDTPRRKNLFLLEIESRSSPYTYLCMSLLWRFKIKMYFFVFMYWFTR